MSLWKGLDEVKLTKLSYVQVSKLQSEGTAAVHGIRSGHFHHMNAFFLLLVCETTNQFLF